MSIAKPSIKVAPQKRFRIAFKDGWAIQLSTGDIEKTLASYATLKPEQDMTAELLIPDLPATPDFNFLFTKNPGGI